MEGLFKICLSITAKHREAKKLKKKKKREKKLLKQDVITICQRPVPHLERQTVVKPTHQTFHSA